MSKEVFIFDLDGTLIDTDRGFFLCMNEILRTCGKEEISFERYQEVAYHQGVDWFVALGLNKEIVQKAYPEVGEDWIKDLSQIFSERYQEEYHKYVPLIDPEIGLWLEQQRKLGVKLIVATNSNGDIARNELERLGILQHFNLVVGQGDGEFKKKPDKSMFDFISKTAKVHPLSHNITMIGDTLNDSRFAKVSGVDFILLSKQRAILEHPEMDKVKRLPDIREFRLLIEGKYKEQNV